MSTITIDETRYQELLKYEAICKKKPREPRQYINDNLLLEAIRQATASYPMHGQPKTYELIVKPVFYELYGDRAGVRARQKAWKDGLCRLKEKGVIDICQGPPGRSIINLLDSAPQK